MFRKSDCEWVNSQMLKSAFGGQLAVYCNRHVDTACMHFMKDYDISVPANTQIEFKFVKIDGAGNITWESGLNHVYTTPSSNTGEVVVNWQ